ncbi:MAG: hypothetical protein ACRD3D_01010 [Terriglobia bacterium]
MGAPNTLPANFSGWDAAPSGGSPATLPANFTGWDKPPSKPPAKPPATLPKHFTEWDNIKARVGNDAEEVYNRALIGANDVNKAVGVPSEKIRESLTNPSELYGGTAPSIENQPGVKTVAGLLAGAADPRNIPFALLGNPEVGTAVRAVAGAALAGIQGAQAVQDVRKGKYGQALVNAGMAGLGAIGAAGAAHAVPVESTEGVANELPEVAEEEGRGAEAAGEAGRAGEPANAGHPALLVNAPEAAAQPALQAGVRPAHEALPLEASHGTIGESPEAISRVASEKSRQVARIRIDTRSGREMPIPNTVDAVDAKPGPYDAIVMRYPDGHEEIADQGDKARPLPDREASVLPVGPGHQTAGSGEGATAAQGLSGLAASVEHTGSLGLPRPEPEPEVPLDHTDASILGSIRGQMHSAWDALKGAYNEKPQASGLAAAVDRFGGMINKSRIAAWRYRKYLINAVPNKADRVGITNWIQAGGDDAILKDRLANAPEEYKPGYEAALSLTDEQKTIARNVSNYFDEKLSQGQRLGLLKDGLENYINQAWAKAPRDVKARLSAMYGGKLDTRFANASRRTFGSFAEGERAGWTPRTKDVAELIPMYDRAFTRSLASRALIKWLSSGVASDNRPLVSAMGGRTPLPDTSEPESVIDTLMGPQLRHNEPEPLPILANPDLRKPNTGDYTAFDHPALKGWTLAGRTPDGQGVLVKGDLALHPEIAEKLKNVLTRSWFQTSESLPARVGRAYLRLGSAVKGSMFFLSPTFHAINEGGMAEANRVNFWHPPSVDETDPITSALLDHSLTLGEENAREGLAATGQWHSKIPVLGPLQDKFQNWLFGPDGYISRLKVATGKALVERNTKLYSKKLNPDEILKLSATQTNGAFGGQNLDSMFRNRTFQDVLRAILLAPDFLESRLRYNFGAFGKYGGATRQALAFDFAQRYAIARVLNQVINGNPHFDKPFGVVHNGREYDMRSNIGDDLRMIQSAREAMSGGHPSWLSYRANPLLTTGIEEMEGRDLYGRKLDAAHRAEQAVGRAVPIWAQGAVGMGKDQSVAESAGTAAGIHDFVYRSPAADILHSAAQDTVPASALYGHSAVGKAVAAARQGRPWEIRKMVAAGKLSEPEAVRAVREARISPMGGDARRAPLDALMKAYHAADAGERKELKPILLHRAALAYSRLPLEDAYNLRDRVREALGSGTRGAANVAVRSIVGAQ